MTVALLTFVGLFWAIVVAAWLGFFGSLLGLHLWERHLDRKQHRTFR